MVERILRGRIVHGAIEAHLGKGFYTIDPQKPGKPVTEINICGDGETTYKSIAIYKDGAQKKIGTVIVNLYRHPLGSKAMLNVTADNLETARGAIYQNQGLPPNATLNFDYPIPINFVHRPNNLFVSFLRMIVGTPSI